MLRSISFTAVYSPMPILSGAGMDKQAVKQKGLLITHTGKDLRAALAEPGVKPQLIKTVIDVAESPRNDVLDR